MAGRQINLISSQIISPKNQELNWLILGTCKNYKKCNKIKSQLKIITA